MTDFLSGFLGNLLADLLAIVVAYQVGLRFHRRVTRERVQTYAAIDTLATRAQVRGVITNASTEPVRYLWWTLAGPTLDGTLGGNDFYEQDGDSAPFVLLPGQTAVTPWFDHDENDANRSTLGIAFTTLDEREVARHVYGPRLRVGRRRIASPAFARSGLRWTLWRNGRHEVGRRVHATRRLRSRGATAAADPSRR